MPAVTTHYVGQASQNQMPTMSIGMGVWDLWNLRKNLLPKIIQIQLQNKTKQKQDKTKITGPAKQNICRPDLVCSLKIGKLG